MSQTCVGVKDRKSKAATNEEKSDEESEGEGGAESKEGKGGAATSTAASTEASTATNAGVCVGQRLWLAEFVGSEAKRVVVEHVLTGSVLKVWLQVIHFHIET